MSQDLPWILITLIVGVLVAIGGAVYAVVAFKRR